MCLIDGSGPVHSPGRTRAEQLRLTHQLRRVSPDLRQLSSRLLRHLLRPWLGSGWTLTDVVCAVDEHPLTGPRFHSRTETGRGVIRSLAGWLIARMRDSRASDGTPMPSHR